jgi:outer membrane immunogenic protein
MHQLRFYVECPCGYQRHEVHGRSPGSRLSRHRSDTNAEVLLVIGNSVYGPVRPPARFRSHSESVFPTAAVHSACRESAREEAGPVVIKQADRGQFACEEHDHGLSNVHKAGSTNDWGAAQAADMPVKAPPPPPAPVYLWTGCYVGGNIGWAQTSAHFTDRFDGDDDGRLSKSGFAGGGQIGCDWQFASNWVFGIQGMIDGADLSRSRESILFPELTFHSDVRWFGTITARLGYLITPQFLFYAKGGIATVRQRFSVNETDTGFVFRSVDTNSSGSDVGVGFEWMFIQNWTFWVEWDHIFLNNKTIDAGGLVLDTIAFTDNIHRDFDKVLFGINWRFGGASAPVAARY